MNGCNEESVLIFADDAILSGSIRRIMQPLKTEQIRWQAFKDDPEGHIKYFNGKPACIFLVEDILNEYGSLSRFVLLSRSGNPFSGFLSKLPLVFVGFRPLSNVIVTEEHGSVLASRSIYYLELPTSIYKIRETICLALVVPVSAISPYLIDPGRQSKQESILMHTLGNFFGSEKLLHGAYLYRVIPPRTFQKALNEIERLQKQHCRDNDQAEYLSYRPSISRSKPTEQELVKESERNIRGKILFIDDLGYLGWSLALAYSLWGDNFKGRTKEINLVRVQEYFNEDAKMTCLDRQQGLGEDDFLSWLIKVVTEKIATGEHADDNFIDEFDMILLDLRLKWKQDEELRKETSGFQVLRAIRNINATIPVMIFTASRRATNMDIVYDMGADDYYMKEYKSSLEEDENYCKNLIQKIKNNIERSFLGAAWPIMKHIEGHCLENGAKDETDYLAKSLILLKKKPLYFEAAQGFDIVGASIILLHSIRELKLERKSISDSFDGGYLLGGLRNLAAHPSSVRFDLDDAKIALYLAIRLFVNNDEILMLYVERAFSQAKPMLPNDIISLSFKKLLAMNGEQRRFEDISKYDYMHISKNETYKNCKAYHYLCFLCERKYHWENTLFHKYYGESDKMAFSYIYEKIANSNLVSAGN